MHIPARFSGDPGVWYARKTIVARRRATLAARHGRTSWAILWDRAALRSATTWREFLDNR